MNDNKGVGLAVSIILGVIVALMLMSGYLGARVEARRFERHGYVITNELGVEAVVTVTPIFEEWRR